MRAYFFSALLLISCQTKKVEPAPAPQSTSAPVTKPSSLSLVSLLPELRLARVFAPRSMNPTYLYDTEDERLANMLFSPLVNCDPKTIEPKPGLLASWKSSDDNQRWELTLRPNLFFSNREPLNADDLISTWLRFLDPNLPTRSSFLLDPIKNARSYHNGERVRAKDAINIKEPALSFTASEPLVAILADVDEATQRSVLYDKPNGKVIGEILAGDIVALSDTSGEMEPLVKVKTLASSASLSGVSLEGYTTKASLKPLYGPTLRAIVKLRARTLSFATIDSPELDDLVPGAVTAPIPGEFAVQVGDKKMMMLRDSSGTFLGWADTSVLEIKTYGAEKILVQSLDGTKRAWVDAKSIELDPSQVGIRKVDALTVEITTSQPAGFIPGLLCRIELTPTPQDLIEREGYSWSSPETLASSGPFMWEKMLPDGGASLVPNSLWYQKALNFSRLSFSRFGKTQADASEGAITKYREGGLDALFLETWTVNTNKNSDLFFRPEHTSIESWQTYHIRVNTTREYLKDPKIRQALVAAIDRDQLKFAMTPSAELFHSLRPQSRFTPDFASYPAPKTPTFDPALAKKLWSEAAKRPTKLKLTSPDWMLTRYLLPELQRQWRDTLGVELEINYLPWRDVNSMNRSGDFDMSIVSWLGDFADPSTFVAMLSSTSPENGARWDDPSFEAALREAESETDFTKRLEKLSKAEEIMLQEAPLIPLFSDSEYYWASDKLQGFTPNSLFLFDWSAMRL